MCGKRYLLLDVRREVVGYPSMLFAPEPAREVCGAGERDVAAITEDAIRSKLTNSGTVFDAVEACFNDLSEDGFHIEKVGFARNVVEVVNRQWQQPSSDELGKDIEAFGKNMRILFRHLNKIRREAERELVSERVSHKINRLKNSFLQDHPLTAKREEAHVLFDDMEATLDEGPESDAVRLTIMNLRRNFEIDDDMTQPIKNYKEFTEGLEQVKYAGRLATQEPSFAEIDLTSETATPRMDKAAVKPKAKRDSAVTTPTE